MIIHIRPRASGTLFSCSLERTPRYAPIRFRDREGRGGPSDEEFDIHRGPIENGWDRLYVGQLAARRGPTVSRRFDRG